MFIFDSQVFKLIESIEALSQKDKAFILDCLLDGVILNEHYKELEYKIQPNKQLIENITNLKTLLKTIET